MSQGRDMGHPGVGWGWERSGKLRPICLVFTLCSSFVARLFTWGCEDEFTDTVGKEIYKGHHTVACALASRPED
jgi:hypothetical protein